MLVEGKVVEGLAGKYTCEKKLGEGGFGVAWLGRKEGDAKERVILKEFRIEWLKDWKAVDLFEREASALKQLKHAGIPAYYDFFAWDGSKAIAVSSLSKSADGASLVLVQEHIDGESLAAKIDAGGRLTAKEAEKILKSLLEILAYLHELHPPVIHRDISPSNVIVVKDPPAGQPAACLIDFGGVQDRLRLASKTNSMSTIGTFGYMPIEQHAGVARATSDLYALGMTMLSAMSHAAPHEMPIDELTSKVKVAEVVPNLDSRMRTVLESMVEPLAARRARSARELLGRLDGAAGDNKGQMLLVASLLLVLGGGIYLSKKSPGQEREQERDRWNNESSRYPTTTTTATTTDTATKPQGPKVALEWKARVKRADNIPAVKVGAECTIRTNVIVDPTANGYNEFRVETFTIQCGDQLIYDQTEKTYVRLSEEPGDAPKAYREGLSVSGGNNGYSVSLDTGRHEGTISSGGKDAFRVALYLDGLSNEISQVIFKYNETRGVSTFRKRSSRQGKIVAVTGKPPFPIGASCMIEASPAWLEKDEKKAKPCDVGMFCNDTYLESFVRADCENDDPFKLDDISFNDDSFGHYKKETHIDFGQSSAKILFKNLRSDDRSYTLDIRLEAPTKTTPAAATSDRDR